MPFEIRNNIHWVGIVDWDLRHFHGHELSTHRGSTYNAYVILDDKKVLVDTVWEPFANEFLRELRKVVDPAAMDYVVVNHAEMDHSGALPALMRLCPNATLIVSRQGAQSVPGHFHENWKLKVVKTGERLSIGKRELMFIEAPMLHWPDTMFTYIAGENILMPNDAFGQHYATAYRFNDQVDQDELFHEAMKYYANIITPYSKMVLRKIDEIVAMNLPIEMILPSHGVLWRKDPMQIVHKYVEWAKQEPQQRAVILYDSMWHATRKMAQAIGQGLADEGVPHVLYNMAVTDRNDVLTDVLLAKAVIIGSPALNNGLLPSITPILEDIKGLRFQNKTGAAFGSYGWSGENVRLIEEHLAKCNIPLAAPGVLAKWQPTEDDLAKCRDLGHKVAEAVKTS